MPHPRASRTKVLWAHPGGRSMRTLARFVAFAIALLFGYAASAAPLSITTLSTRADFVTGGDAVGGVGHPPGPLPPLWVTPNQKEPTRPFPSCATPHTPGWVVTRVFVRHHLLRV